MNSWNYKGIEITIDNKGKFNATASNGKKIVGASIDSIKKQIDKLDAVAFKPFEAMVSVNYGGRGFETVTVNRIDIAARSRDSKVFIIDGKTGYEKERYQVIRKTPENVALCAAYLARRDEIREQLDKLEAELKAIERALPWINPSSCKVQS